MPNENKKYDVFISYRRESGKDYARIIKPELINRHLDVFLDFDELKDGVFDNRILDAIENAPVFMIILSKGSLDRCVNEDDWVRKEIIHAYKNNKHIIPVEVDKTFRNFSEDIPDDIKNIIGQHQFSQVDTETLLQASMNELVEMRIRPYLNTKTVKEGAEIHLEVNYNCSVYRFKEKILHAEINKDNVLFLKKGRHKLEFVADEDETSRETKVIEIPEIDYTDFIEVSLKAPRKQQENPIFTIDGIEFKMIDVEGGTFTMGATSEQGSEAYDDENPTHSVTLSSYYMGETEVTQALWQAVMGNNPSKFKGDNLPVEKVSYKDIQEFITKLNQKTGKTFRLPTEAEWEYAARGGNKSKGYKYSGSNNLNDVAWYDENSNSKTHPVKTKQANELGLYDMSGNVYEWCSDWYGEYSSSSQTNPQGPNSGSNRVVRGGSWSYNARYCRVSYRGISAPSRRDSDNGFRLALAR